MQRAALSCGGLLRPLGWEQRLPEGEMGLHGCLWWLDSWCTSRQASVCTKTFQPCCAPPDHRRNFMYPSREALQISVSFLVLAPSSRSRLGQNKLCFAAPCCQQQRGLGNTMHGSSVLAS